MLTIFKNEKFSQSARIIKNRLDNYINPLHISTNDKISIIEKIKYSDFIDFFKKIKPNKSVTLMEGNISEIFINDVIDKISVIDTTNTCNLKIENIIKQPTNNNDLEFNWTSENPSESNDCTYVLYNYGYSNSINNPDHYKFVAATQIINLFFNESFFDELRTKQQLGYVVGTSNSTFGPKYNKMHCQSFIVQSDNTKCDEIFNKINDYVQNAIQQFCDISNDTFKTYVDTLVKQINEPEKNLQHFSSYDLNIILSNKRTFNVKEIFTDEYNKIDKLYVTNFLIDNYQKNVKKYIMNIHSNC